MKIITYVQFYITTLITVIFNIKRRIMYRFVPRDIVKKNGTKKT